jgi:hypothetical protein
MNPDLDRRVFGDSSYGLYIVTSRDGDQMNGQIVNTVIQVLHLQQQGIWSYCFG